MLMKLSEDRKYVAWAGRTPEEKRVLKVAKSKGLACVLMHSGKFRRCETYLAPEYVHWTDYELQPEDVVPEGWRLVTDEDRKQDKPECAKYWNYISKTWEDASSVHWGCNDIYIIPTSHKWEQERNDDGDTIEDMRAVQNKFGKGSIAFCDIFGEWSTMIAWEINTTNYTINQFRIHAKHADKFDPDSMDFETWARAVIGRGMIIRGETSKTFYYDSLNGEAGLNSTTKYTYRNWESGYTTKNGDPIAFTAITKAQYEQETQPKEPSEAQVMLFEVDWTVNIYPHHEGDTVNIGDRIGKYRIVGYTDYKDWMLGDFHHPVPCCITVGNELQKRKYAIGILDEKEVQA